MASTRSASGSLAPSRTALGAVALSVLLLAFTSACGQLVAGPAAPGPPAAASPSASSHRFAAPTSPTLQNDSASTSTQGAPSSSSTTTEASTIVVDEVESADSDSPGAGRFEYIQVISSPSPSPTHVAKEDVRKKVPSLGGAGGAVVDIEPAMEAGLQFLAGIYNPHRWFALPGGLSGQCRAHLRTYLGALANGTTWAVQMTDASGRYSSQFFFGNDFWLGSHTLCEELGTPYALANPPWPVSFHVVQLAVHLDAVLTPHTRVISLGVCLPRTCDPKDITALLHAASKGAVVTVTPVSAAPPGPSAKAGPSAKSVPKAPSLEVRRIRRIPGTYSLMADTKLHILAGVTAMVVILMAAGGMFELLYKRQARIQRQRQTAAGLSKGVHGGDSTAGRQTDSERQGGQHHSVMGVGASPSHEMQENPKEHPRKGNQQRPLPLPLPHRNGVTPAQSQLNDKKAADAGLPRPGVMVQIVMAFSPISNAAKILNCEALEEDSLTAVHGLRFLSLAWVILVHTYLQVFAIAENKTLRTVTERNFMFQTVSNATFSVDTFFFISGLLVAFLYFKQAAKLKEREEARPKSHHGEKKLSAGVAAVKDLGKFLILLGYRFVRLTPAYLFVLGMVELSMRWIHNNSVFEPNILDQLNCDKYWWRNALYINSLFPRKDMCMLWSWYMSNDTQFYVLGIFLLLLSSRYFRFVAAAVGTLLVSSWITTAFVSVQYEYHARIQEPFAKFDELYDKPWTRLGPYLVGMASGWLLQRTNCKIRMPMTVVFAGWTLSLLCLVSLVYGLLHQNLGIPASAAYVSLGHTAWSVALGWIVIACCTGYGAFINTLLSFRALYPLSRLTYCAYLLHPMIMVLTSYQMDGPLHLHNSLVLTLYFGNVVASYLLSFLISLAYEAPVVRLLKIALPPQKKSD